MKGEFNMKPTGLLCILSIFVSLNVCGDAMKQSISVIPQPVSVEMKDGVVTIEPSTRIVAVQKELLPLAKVLSQDIYLATGIRLACKSGAAAVRAEDICLKLDRRMSNENHRISIGAHAVVQGGNYNSVALGTVTLLQLIREKNGKLMVPKLVINDSPELAYRGILLDVARFWNPPETVKRTIDLMRLYKYNYLHLHLSDHQLYVLPSKAFPNLPTVSRDGRRLHYTEEEVRDFVNYAKERGIIIVPEVDVPSHAGNLVKKVPEMFGTTDPKTGEPRSIGGVVNMASEKTYTAFDTLVGEMCDLFSTSPYIHIGGDEVSAGHLTKLPEYQPYVKKHGLKEAKKGNVGELFTHFIDRVNTIVNKHGKQSLIWEGFHSMGTENARIPTNMIVMVWSTKYNRPDTLAKEGFPIINCNWMPLYVVPPQNCAFRPDQAYDWNYRTFPKRNQKAEMIILPESAPVCGAQICLWEQRYNLVMPRLRPLMPMISERIWNPGSGKSFTQVEKDFAIIDSLARKITEPVVFEAAGLLKEGEINFDDAVTVTMKSDVPETIRYRLDKEFGSFPDAASQEYTGPIRLANTMVVTAQLFDEKGKSSSGVTQKRYTKIVPAYRYAAYSPAPPEGWLDMPDFSQMTPAREGVLGYATEDRVKEVNRVMFVGVPSYGHVDTRPYELYGPYAFVSRGQVRIPEDGEYEVKLRANDGMGELYFGNKRIAFNTRFGGKDVSKGKLKAGIYPFTIKYFYRNIFNDLNITIKGPGMNRFEPFDSFVLPLAEHIKKAELKRVPKGTEFIIPAQKANWNLAINKPVTSSDGTQGGNIPRNAVNGNTENNAGWHAAPWPQWIEVDLQSLYTIDRIKIHTWYDNHRYYQYIIETSPDSIAWHPVVDMSSNTTPSTKEGFEHKITPVLARFVKVKMLKNSANEGVHLNEIMVFEKSK
jgi:hexosaminidase